MAIYLLHLRGENRECSQYIDTNVIARAKEPLQAPGSNRYWAGNLVFAKISRGPLMHSLSVPCAVAAASGVYTAGVFASCIHGVHVVSETRLTFTFVHHFTNLSFY